MIYDGDEIIVLRLAYSQCQTLLYIYLHPVHSIPQNCRQRSCPGLSPSLGGMPPAPLRPYLFWSRRCWKGKIHNFTWNALADYSEWLWLNLFYQLQNVIWNCKQSFHYSICHDITKSPKTIIWIFSSKINYIEQDKNYGQKPNVLLFFILTYLVWLQLYEKNHYIELPLLLWCSCGQSIYNKVASCGGGSHQLRLPPS